MPSESSNLELPPGSWKLQAMTQGGKDVKIPDGVEVTVIFEADRIFGHGGCNSYQGAFQAARDGAFQMTEQGWTEMACDGVGEDFDMVYTDALWTVRRLSWSPKSVELADDSGQNRMLFIPSE